MFSSASFSFPSGRSSCMCVGSRCIIPVLFLFVTIPFVCFSLDNRQGSPFWLPDALWTAWPGGSPSQPFSLHTLIRVIVACACQLQYWHRWYISAQYFLLIRGHACPLLTLLASRLLFVCGSRETRPMCAVREPDKDLREVNRETSGLPLLSLLPLSDIPLLSLDTLGTPDSPLKTPSQSACCTHPSAMPMCGETRTVLRGKVR